MAVSLEAVGWENAGAGESRLSKLMAEAAEDTDVPSGSDSGSDLGSLVSELVADAEADMDVPSGSGSGARSESSSMAEARELVSYKRIVMAVGLGSVYVTWAMFAWFIFVRAVLPCCVHPRLR